MAEINAITQKQTNISSSTKVKLESLGINVSSVSSESEAQTLIDKLKAAKQGMVNQQQEAQSSSSTDSTSETETLAEAKSLAETMGLVVASDASIEDIISQITTRIQELATSTNQSDRQLAQAYQVQLNTISTQYQSVQASQNSMYSAMEMMSINNKYSLNL
ncbi:MAG: hypothetical protein ACI4S3_04155 [Candidatus Gastranaerophilaceae bacterium]